MTNEDKAKQLYRKYRDMNFAPESAAFNAAMEIAEWKDEQFKEEKKQWIEKTAKWFEDNFKDWFEEEMLSNIIIEFKKVMKGE